MYCLALVLGSLALVSAQVDTKDIKKPSTDDLKSFFASKTKDIKAPSTDDVKSFFQSNTKDIKVPSAEDFKAALLSNTKDIKAPVAIGESAKTFDLSNAKDKFTSYLKDKMAQHGSNGGSSQFSPDMFQNIMSQLKANENKTLQQISDEYIAKLPADKQPAAKEQQTKTKSQMEELIKNMTTTVKAMPDALDQFVNVLSKQDLTVGQLREQMGAACKKLKEEKPDVLYALSAALKELAKRSVYGAFAEKFAAAQGQLSGNAVRPQVMPYFQDKMRPAVMPIDSGDNMNAAVMPLDYHHEDNNNADVLTLEYNAEDDVEVAEPKKNKKNKNQNKKDKKKQEKKEKKEKKNKKHVESEEADLA